MGGGELDLVTGRTTYLIDRCRPFYKEPLEHEHFTDTPLP